MGKSDKTAENLQTYFHSSLFNNSLETLCHRIMIYCRFSLIVFFTVIYFRVLSGSYIKSAKMHMVQSQSFFFEKAKFVQKERTYDRVHKSGRLVYVHIVQKTATPSSTGRSNQFSIFCKKIFQSKEEPRLENMPFQSAKIKNSNFKYCFMH